MNLGSPDFDNNRSRLLRLLSSSFKTDIFFQYKMVRDGNINAISVYRGVLNNYGTSIDGEQRKSAVERQGTDSSSVDTGSPSASESSCATATACDSEPDRSEEQLPPGWEKHEGKTNKQNVL
jgi:hypothetical protein